MQALFDSAQGPGYKQEVLSLIVKRHSLVSEEGGEAIGAVVPSLH